ncbi:hypothetical protein [Natronosalvus halobius]|uniref:hypothetical protein n=1 Tax=Natronosalvus halobius TaxID=2953746 RepID=UPI00209E7C49|nr:hypothetical protein [Natronosalvus halobius]USZ71266.1 hypothetical protein NGM15_14455 [Natronosalvus halobius]
MTIEDADRIRSTLEDAIDLLDDVAMEEERSADERRTYSRTAGRLRKIAKSIPEAREEQ